MKNFRNILGSSFDNKADQLLVEEAPIHRLIHLILIQAVRYGATEVSILPPVDLPDHLREKTEDLHGRQDQRNDEDTEWHGELNKEMIGAGIIPDPIFPSSPFPDVPVFYRVNDEWHEVEGFPFRLLHIAIAVLERVITSEMIDDHEHQRKKLRLMNSDTFADIELWFEENHSYKIKINKVY